MLALIVVLFSIVLPQPNTPFTLTITDITNHQTVYATYEDTVGCHTIAFLPFNESTTVHEDFFNTDQYNHIVVDFEQDETGQYNDIFWYRGVDFAMIDLGPCDNTRGN